MSEDRKPKARISWWVYAGSERIPRSASMRGLWNYDATCSCGWDSRTGGAVRSYVEREVWMHKRLDHGEDV
jgi:hypothetical protein